MSNPESNEQPEPKADAMNRLKREGRWEEASKFRHQERERFRKAGAKMQDARDLSWESMISRFPPLAVEVSAATSGAWGSTPEDDADVEELCHRHEGEEPDLVSDIVWVYQNLDNRQLRPLDFPSPGSWNLLCWAHGAQNKFMENLLPKALLLKEKQREIESRQSGQIDSIMKFMKTYEDLYGPVSEELEQLQVKRKKFWEQRKAALERKGQSHG